MRTPHLLTTLLETPILQASCGWRHTALVLEDGSLYVAGDDEHGQLGLGGRADGEAVAKPGRLVATMTRVPGLSTLRVAQVACGRSHTAFVCEAGELYSMGLGLYGQLGLGTLVSESQPRRVPHVDGAAAFVACGDLHTLVLRSDGRALSCGFNDAGRLGRTLDDVSATCAESLGALPLHAAASASSDAFAVVALSAGGAHTALITADGSAYTCGRGDHGQLGHGREAASAREPGTEAPAAALPRRVAALKQHKIRRAALGASHSLFLTSQGLAYACGCGVYGRLGLGTRESAFVPMALPALEGIVIVQISAGAAHSSFVSDEGHVYLCGDDGSGQLGLNLPKQCSLTPQQPRKFASREHVRVLGASCGGQHTAFLLQAVVDAKEDYSEEQVAAAASVIESLFRGRHVRHLNETAAQRKRNGRADLGHSAAQRHAAACVIQAGWRLHLSILERERREQLRQLRALRDHADDGHWWRRIQGQFDTASASKAFEDAGVAARYLTKASW